MYKPMKLKHFKKSHINTIPITKELIENIMSETSDECPFSTFPYVFDLNSHKSNKLHHSGNCVALSMYLKDKLKQHNIKSILIPASIPKIYSNPKYLKISHVALAILLNLDEAFICDPAFYFMQPMRVSSTSDDIGEILSKNIYSNLTETFVYNLEFQPNDDKLNPFQTIPGPSFHVKTHKKNEPSDTWNYYLMEILNPDNAISSFFMSAKQYPFITYTNKKFELTLYIKFIDKDTISIKYGDDLLYLGNPSQIPQDVKDFIKPYMHKHFGPSYEKFFNLPPQVGSKIYNIKDSHNSKKNKKKNKTRKNT